MSEDKSKITSHKEEAIVSSVMESVNRLMRKPFGRLVIEKHDAQLYVEEVDKRKMTVEK